jgi:hypothetical protein
VLRENVGDSTAVPTGNRSLRSVNFPDRYVRHRDNLGYLDPLSSASGAADRQAATFTIGAGLANGNCYTLQSINPTGRYLRHSNNRLVLSANDGTAMFRNDATFCGRAGLSGTGTTSFESYNYPGFYLRHYNYELRIDRNDGSATLKADASFTVTSPLG